MAKTLYFTGYNAVFHRGNNDANMAPTATWWTPYDLLEVRGFSTTATNTASITGPTNGVDVRGSTTALAAEWISPPLSADFTISGTITLNLWAYEATMNDNVAINAVVDKVDGATGVITRIANTARVTEVALTTAAVNNFTVTPTSTAVKRGDRLRVRVYGDDLGATAMAAGGSFTFTYASPSAGVSGDSYITFNENLTFELDGNPGVISSNTTVGTSAIGNQTSQTASALSFVATGPDLTSFSMWLSKVGSPTDNLIIELQTNSGGNPSGTVVATVATITGASLTGTSTQTASYGPVTGLTAGTTYWLVFRRSGAIDTLNYYNFGTSNTGAAVSDPRCRTYGSGGWAAFALTGSTISVVGQLAVSTYYLTDTASTPISPLSIPQVATTSVAVGQNTNTTRQAQSFVPPTGVTTITEVRAWLNKNGTPTDNFIVEIQSDSSGSPSGTVLSTIATIAGSALTGTLTQTTWSGLSISVTAGSTYWIVFRRSGAIDVANAWGVGGAVGAIYGALRAWNGTSWLTASTFATASIYVAGDSSMNICKTASTSRGSGVINSVTNTVAGPVAGIQVRNSVGGAGVPIEWYTPPLNAVTFGGKAKAVTRGYESTSAINASLRAEIAITDGNGLNAVVWGTACIETSAVAGEVSNTADTAYNAWVSGDDTAITAGQRLRFRVYIEDLSEGPLVTGGSFNMSYNGATAAATGDSYVILPLAVTEQISSTPLPIGRISAATTVRGTTLGVSGSAPISIGRESGATTVRGLTLSGTGTAAPVVIGKVGGYSGRIRSLAPSAYWRLGSSPLVDASGNGNTLTVNGTPTAVASLLPSDLSDGSRDFVSNQYYQAGTWTPPVPPFTVEAWTVSDGTASADIVDKFDSWFLRIDAGKWAYEYYAGATWRAVISPVSLTVGAMYHLVAVHGTSNVDLYVNGALVATAATFGAPTPNANAFYIGSGGFPYDGRIDEVAVYPAALNATAVAANYTAGFSGTSVIRGITIVPAPQTVIIGRKAAATTVRGTTISGAGTVSLVIGRKTAATTVRGATLAAAGTVSVVIGKKISATTVYGTTVAGAPVNLPIGAKASATTVRGATLAPAGAAPIVIGRKAAATTVRGATLAATGTVSLVIGRKATATTVRGTTLAPAGAAPIVIGRKASATIVRGATLSNVAIPDQTVPIGRIGGAAGFPTTAILDSFTRADENPIGGKWTTDFFTNGGVASGSLKLVSNQLSGSGGSTTWTNSWWNGSGSAGPQERMLANTAPSGGSGTGDFTLGVRFTAGTNGLISHIRYWHPGTGSSAPVCSLWDTVGASKLATVTDSSPGGAGFREVALPTPVPVVAGTSYTASVTTNGATYEYTAAVPTSLAPHLVSPFAYYNNGADVFPSISPGTSHYHVDVVFETYVLGPDVEFGATIGTLPPIGTDEIAGFGIRLVNIAASATDGYIISVSRQPTAGDFFIFTRLDNSNQADFGTGSTTTKAAAGDKYGVEMIGSTIKLWAKYGSNPWTVQGTATSATYTAAGNVGIEMYGNTSRLDDVFGGTVVIGTGGSVVRGVTLGGISSIPIGWVPPLGAYGANGYGSEAYGGQTVYGVVLVPGIASTSSADTGTATESASARVFVTSTDSNGATTETPLRLSYSAQVLADSPTGYWRMDDTLPVQDASASAFHLTGDVRTVAQVPGLLPAEPTGKARGFTAVGGGSFLNRGLTYGGAFNTFSIETWVKRDTPTASEILLCQYNGGISLALNSNGTIALAKDFVGTCAVTSTLKITDTNAHHVVVTRNGIGGAVVFYLDGVSETPTPTNPNYDFTPSASSFFIGSQWGSSPFTGTLDEVAIYPTVLSPARVAAHYSTGLTAGLVTPAVQITATDANGSTAEVASNGVPVTGTDAGSSSQAQSLAAAIPTSDASGTLQETTRVTQTSQEASGVTTELGALTAALSASDANSTTTDTAIATAPGAPGGTDSGLGSDSATVLVKTTTVEAGTAAEATTLVARPSATDGNGATTESASIVLASFVSLDTGAGSESATVLAKPAGSDSASGTETPSLLAKVTGTDSNSLTSETVTTTLAFSTTDTNGTTSETSSLTAALTSTQIGTGSDSISRIVYVLTESGIGSDTAFVSYRQSQIESGAGSEVQSLSVSLFQTDTGLGIQNAAVFVNLGYYMTGDEPHWLLEADIDEAGNVIAVTPDGGKIISASPDGGSLISVGAPDEEPPMNSGLGKTRILEVW